MYLVVGINNSAQCSQSLANLDWNEQNNCFQYCCIDDRTHYNSHTKSRMDSDEIIRHLNVATCNSHLNVAQRSPIEKKKQQIVIAAVLLKISLLYRIDGMTGDCALVPFVPRHHDVASLSPRCTPAVKYHTSIKVFHIYRTSLYNSVTYRHSISGVSEVDPNSDFI